MGEIEIKCDVAGHEGEMVRFKPAGWKFKHLRIWQQALLESSLTVAELADLVSERLAGWTLKDEEGAPVEFRPGREAFDELPPPVATFVVSSLKQAYYLSQAPDPNA